MTATWLEVGVSEPLGVPLSDLPDDPTNARVEQSSRRLISGGGQIMKLNTVMLLLLVALVVFSNYDAFGQLIWTKYAGNPVMQSGQGLSWDRRDIYPCPLLFRDSVYHLWYTGWDGTDNSRYIRSGYARSTNGITWNKHTTPVLDVGNPGAWDSYDAEACAVLYDGAQYKMWYSGYTGSAFNQQVGYATGVSETTWTKRANPVLSPGPSGSWDVAAAMWPMVIRSSPGGGFKMWYTGWDGSKLVDGSWINNQIGYATATNETTWTKHPLNPVLSAGPSGSWDDARVIYGAVVYDSVAHLYYMFYTGMNRATEVQRIGVATSRDGIAWTKYSGNPVLAPGPIGSWDAKTLVGGGVVMVRDTFRLLYTGIDAYGATRFGDATSPLSPWVDLASPANGGLVKADSCRLLWYRSFVPALKYRVQVAIDSVFTSLLVDDSTLTDTSKLVRGLLDKHSYWWRVCARNSNGWGIFSSAQKISITITGIIDRLGTPTQYALGQNYPNPFNPTTTIKFELPKASHVSLSVYDILGREVSVLVNERREAGVHEVKFDGSNLASGVYFYRLRAGDFVTTKRLLLLR
jgi:predicted GH43/DUF377 family glycosyl hydrolase